MGKRARQARRQGIDPRERTRGGFAAPIDEGRPPAAGHADPGFVVAPGYPDEWRARVWNEREKIRRSNRELERLIARAVGAGATWSGVAAALGCSRQWARKKYGYLSPVVDPSLPASAGS